MDDVSRSTNDNRNEGRTLSNGRDGCEGKNVSYILANKGQENMGKSCVR